MTPNTKNRIHSQFGNLKIIQAYDRGPEVQIHPDDATDRGVAMGVKLHRLADDVGHLVEFTVIHVMQRLEYPPLHWLQSIDDVGNGPFQDHIGGIVNEVVLVHARQMGDFHLICATFCACLD